MVICGVNLNPKTLDDLKVEGVTDSKKIRPERREELDIFLREKVEDVVILEFEPQRIDNLRKEGINLNQIEEIGFSRILDKLCPQKAYIDSASANAEKFSEDLENRLKNEINMTVEHEADINYLPVSAASIIAKVRRDKRIEELKERYGETGSGYPVDKRTVQFLENWVEKNRKLPDFARKTWKTAKRILAKTEK